MDNKRNSSKTIEVLFKISEAVSHTRNLDELYQVIHQSLGEILNVDNFYIAIYHKEKDAITFPYYVDEKDEDPEEIINFSKTRSSAGRVVQSKKPMIFYTDQIVRLANKGKHGSAGSGSKIWLGAPLIINNRVKGAIVIQSYETITAYGKEDLDLLNSVSQHIALAIERKASDEKLMDQRKVLETILESSPMGIALVQDRVFKWVNNEMVRMFGYQSKLEFENHNTRMIYSSQADYDLIGEKLYRSLSTIGMADYEIDLVKADGTFFPAHIRMNCGDLSKPMSWAIATVTDISQRKAVEKETVERERLQGVLEMAGAVCHEINQPLQAILGYSELLQMRQVSEKMDTHTVNSIKSQACRLGRITRKLSNITCYRTVDYPGNAKIVDIWSAGKDPEDGR